MTVSLWRIASDKNTYAADDLSGAGAERTGGRWNRRGRPAVYTSSTIALACLETVVHLNVGRLPLNRYLIRVDAADDVWAARQVHLPENLPLGWSAIPEGKESLDVGDAWLSALTSALLVVPSVIVPEESNVLVNPRHPDAGKISATKVRVWSYDGRLL